MATKRRRTSEQTPPVGASMHGGGGGAAASAGGTYRFGIHGGGEGGGKRASAKTAAFEVDSPLNDDGESAGDDDGASELEHTPTSDADGGRSTQGEVLARLIEKQPAQEIIMWIQQTYQTAERESLPRAVLYGHYREHCEQRGAPVWNIANFGRLLRYCFPAVRIRRLGHRHQSKYYYEGIAVRPDSELSRREDVIMTQRSGDRARPLLIARGPQTDGRGYAGQATRAGASNGGGGRPDPNTVDTSLWPVPTMLAAPNTIHFLQTLRNQWIGTCDLPVNQFAKACDALVTSFVQNASPILNDLRVPAVANFVRETFLTATVSMFLRTLSQGTPELSGEKLRIARDFAFRLDQTLAMVSGLTWLPVRTIVAGSLRALSQALRRGVLLAQLTNSATAILADHGQLLQMIEDFRAIDFRMVMDEAQSIFGTENRNELVEDVMHAFAEVILLLQPGQASLTKLRDFLRLCIVRAITTQRNAPVGATSNGQMLVLRISYVECLLMRDLTSRSAASFGSFQLLRLYIDECVHTILNEFYFQQRWPLYRMTGSNLRVMHPLMFVCLEATGCLAASTPDLPPPPPPPASSSFNHGVGGHGYNSATQAELGYGLARPASATWNGSAGGYPQTSSTSSASMSSVPGQPSSGSPSIAPTMPQMGSMTPNMDTHWSSPELAGGAGPGHWSSMNDNAGLVWNSGLSNGRGPQLAGQDGHHVSLADRHQHDHIGHGHGHGVTSAESTDDVEGDGHDDGDDGGGEDDGGGGDGGEAGDDGDDGVDEHDRSSGSRPAVRQSLTSSKLDGTGTGRGGNGSAAAQAAWEPDARS